MSKIKSYVVEINGIRYERVFSSRPLSVCTECDLNKVCGSDEMGAPCSGGRDEFIKEQ
mgnify:FL=1